jgi:HSP20 family molecular chaperone IbpA
MATVQRAKQVARPEAPANVVRPEVDVFEDSQGITVLADLPGVGRDSVNVHVEDYTLTIEGRMGAPETGSERIHTEIHEPLYRRSFTLSRELDAGAIEATLKDGVLKVSIPKRASARPRRIEVQVN